MVGNFQIRHKRRLSSPYFRNVRGSTLVINPDNVNGSKRKVSVWNGNRFASDKKVLGNPKKYGNVDVIDFPSKQDVSDERFNFCIQLQVAVPSTKMKDKAVSDSVFEKRVADVVKFMGRTLGTKYPNGKEKPVEIFGGTTSNTSYGTYYLESKHEWVGENVVVVSAWTTKDVWAKWDLFFKEWLRKKCIEWGQESVQFVFSDGEFRNSFLIFAKD